MAASTVPAAKQKILDLLTAIPALNTAGITWGEPTEQEDLQDTLVYFEDPVTREPEWSTLGGAPLDETYTLTLVAKTRIFEDDRGRAETATWELVHTIMTALRENLRLDMLLRKPIVFGEQELSTAAVSDGWFGEAILPLVCNARI